MLKLGSGECKSIIITACIPYDEEQYQKGQDKSCKFEMIFDWRQDISVNGSSTGTTVTEPAIPNPPSTEPSVTEPQVTNPPVAEPPATNPPATDPEVVEPSEPGLPQIDAPAVVEPEIVKPVKDKDRVNGTDGEKFSKAVFSGGGASSGGGGAAIVNSQYRFEFKDLKHLLTYLKKHFGIEYAAQIAARSERYSRYIS